MTERTLIARWQTRGNRYWLELYQDQSGYGYRGDNCGGFMGAISKDEAMQKMQARVESYRVDCINLKQVPA